MLFISLFDLLVLGSAIYLYFQKCSELSLLIVVVISQPPPSLPQLVDKQKASVYAALIPTSINLTCRYIKLKHGLLHVYTASQIFRPPFEHRILKTQEQEKNMITIV